MHEYGAYAFRHLKFGLPGPGHLDFRRKVARARFKSATGSGKDFYDKTRYRSGIACPSLAAWRKSAVKMTEKAERPPIVGGAGRFPASAHGRALKSARGERGDIAVVTSA
ncbi:MAG: hypothetical protein IPF49_03685 [Gammaproteobacteria bacterium]|nr:hypothetical protein [Gammaproteobacteria bacterium]